MKKLNYDFLNCAKKMPPMCHRKHEKFDIRDSEVARWLISQPDIMQKIFNMATNNGVIKYDREAGCWKGIDYDDD
ncbi:MAG: hypothetical protein Q4P20_11565 [Eubacteriales bacterium]|nr:hypothetical protein [Eubacteriales bacterium]